MSEPSIETKIFSAEDGWLLTGDLYRGSAPRIAVLVSAGTGFPRRFYRHIAAYLATRGAVVLTYDYRGIGDSGSQNLATSGITYTEWGQLDMSAAMKTLQDAAPDLPVGHIGHSVGGQFAGFMPNHASIARHAFIAVGSGYWRAHPPYRWPLEWYFWWGMGSYSLARHGHIARVGGWSGAPLPPDVFRTWRRWSMQPGYFLRDLQDRRYEHHFDKVKSPICSWIFPDDGIATPRAAKDILACYPAVEKHLLLRSPKAIGKTSIGHDGAFRKGYETLWGECWDWLADGVLPTGAAVA